MFFYRIMNYLKYRTSFKSLHEVVVVAWQGLFYPGTSFGKIILGCQNLEKRYASHNLKHHEHEKHKCQKMIRIRLTSDPLNWIRIPRLEKWNGHLNTSNLVLDGNVLDYLFL